MPHRAVFVSPCQNSVHLKLLLGVPAPVMTPDNVLFSSFFPSAFTGRAGVVHMVGNNVRHAPLLVKDRLPLVGQGCAVH